MTVIGIVAEYNPFHSGHAYQIVQTRKAVGEDTAVIAVMSGNWVQQAECAILDKWERSRIALAGGVDLVLELPTPWATASAERFARGAVSVLERCGVTEVLSFGSECGDIGRLAQAAACIDSVEWKKRLAGFLEQGYPFAQARQAAVQSLLEEEGELLSFPNNNLGVEYIRALRCLGSEIRPYTVQRWGAGHNSLLLPVGEETPPPTVSATQIRQDLRNGRLDRDKSYLGEAGFSLLKGQREFPSMQYLERAMLAKIRTMGERDWAALPDSGESEGLPKRLVKAAGQARSMEEFYMLAKTRRYTHARLRRLALWAFLGIRSEQLPELPPYLRVLGFNERGQTLLKEIKQKSTLPVLTKPAHARKLGGAALQMMELESQCTDLYDLCYSNISAPGREWTAGPVRLDHAGGIV